MRQYRLYTLQQNIVASPISSIVVAGDQPIYWSLVRVREEPSSAHYLGVKQVAVSNQLGGAGLLTELLRTVAEQDAPANRFVVQSATVDAGLGLVPTLNPAFYTLWEPRDSEQFAGDTCGY